MKQVLLRSRCCEGAVGLSAGLTYTPGMYADNEELFQLCTVVAELGGFFSPHHRSYGAGALEAYAEMIDLTARAGCALHLAHATMNFGPNKGRAGELLALLDAAIADGADISPRHLPVPARRDHAVRDPAQLVRRPAAAPPPSPACRTRPRSPGSASTSRSPAPTVATA